MPSDDSAKLALRTQQIIAHETNIPNYPDPFGGSYLIEEMTNNFIENSFKIIDEIDEIGGALEAIENGWIENQISKSAYEYQKGIDDNSNIIIGVNQFIDESSESEHTFQINTKSVDKQIDSIHLYKKNISKIDFNEKLNMLKKTAASNENIMPAILECVKNQCTLGEISDTLREVFGNHE